MADNIFIPSTISPSYVDLGSYLDNDNLIIRCYYHFKSTDNIENIIIKLDRDKEPIQNFSINSLYPKDSRTYNFPLAIKLTDEQFENLDIGKHTITVSCKNNDTTNTSVFIFSKIDNYTFESNKNLLNDYYLLRIGGFENAVFTDTPSTNIAIVITETDEVKIQGIFDENFNFYGDIGNNLKKNGLIYGEYILTGCPNGSFGDRFCLFVEYEDKYGDKHRFEDWGEGITFSVPIDHLAHWIGAGIYIKGGVTLDRITFSPMLRSTEFEDETYEPYMNPKQMEIMNMSESKRLGVVSKLNDLWRADIDWLKARIFAIVEAMNKFRDYDGSGIDGHEIMDDGMIVYDRTPQLRFINCEVTDSEDEDTTIVEFVQRINADVTVDNPTWNGHLLTAAIHNEYLDEGNQDHFFTYPNDFYTYSGDINATEPGTYSLTLGIIDRWNFAWSNRTVGQKVFKWTIQKIMLPTPYLENTTFTFNMAYQGPTLKSIMDVGTFVTQTGTTKAKNAGTYSITFSINDKNHYCWSDRSTNDKVYSWKINKLKLAIPNLSSNSFTFNAKAQGPGINGINATYINTSGTTSATHVGNYNVTYSLKDTVNTEWSDGTTSNKTGSWSINKRTITIPSLSTTEFDWTGNIITPTLVNMDYTYIKISGETKGTDVSEYTINLDLLYTSDTVWSDNSITQKTIKWKIKGMPLVPISYPSPKVIKHGNWDFESLMPGEGDGDKLGDTYCIMSPIIKWYREWLLQGKVEIETEYPYGDSVISATITGSDVKKEVKDMSYRELYDSDIRIIPVDLPPSKIIYKYRVYAKYPYRWNDNSEYKEYIFQLDPGGFCWSKNLLAAMNIRNMSNVFCQGNRIIRERSYIPISILESTTILIVPYIHSSNAKLTLSRFSANSEYISLPTDGCLQVTVPDHYYTEAYSITLERKDINDHYGILMGIHLDYGDEIMMALTGEVVYS